MQQLVSSQKKKAYHKDVSRPDNRYRSRSVARWINSAANRTVGC